jgi:hypothetical protein
MPSITDAEGNIYDEGHPDYLKVKVANLEGTVSELLTAVVDLQNRVTRLDDEPLQWPADAYEPTHTKPA